jgi:WD40 repeat protein
MVVGITITTFLGVPSACLSQQPWAVFAGEGGNVWCLAFSPDGKTLAAACTHSRVELWEVSSGRRRAVLEHHRDSVLAVAFSPNGRLLASGDENGTIVCWDLRANKVRAILRGHTKPVRSVAFGPDSKRLLSAGLDGTVRLWEASGRGENAILSVQGDCVCSVSCSLGGPLLASGGCDGTVRLWDRGNREQVACKRLSRPVYAVTFSPDGKVLASQDETGTVRLHYARSLTETWSFRWPTGAERAQCGESLAFSPDGLFIAGCGASGGRGENRVGRVWLHDTADRKHVATLNAASRSAHAIAFSPDGRLLAAGHSNGTVGLWDVAAVLKAGK